MTPYLSTCSCTALRQFSFSIKFPATSRTLSTLLLNHPLGPLGIRLFFWEVDNGDVSAFAGEENSHGAANSRAGLY